jgi:uncharacterized protein YgiB involved in biofilm formation
VPFGRRRSKERVSETNEQSLEWRMEKGRGIVQTWRQSSGARNGVQQNGNKDTEQRAGNDSRKKPCLLSSIGQEIVGVTLRVTNSLISVISVLIKH